MSFVVQLNHGEKCVKCASYVPSALRAAMKFQEDDYAGDDAGEHVAFVNFA